MSLPMLALYKYLLGPLLLAQGVWTKRTALRLPEADGPRLGKIRVEGDLAPLRLLVVGDSSAAGVGVAHQSEALALPVAQAVVRATGRSVSWQLIAKSGLNTGEALALIRASHTNAADIAVTALGVNDVLSQQIPREFQQNYAALLRHLKETVGVKGTVVSGVPPMQILPGAPQPLRWYLGQYAAQLDVKLRELCLQHEGARYLSLQWAAKPEEMAVDRFHPGPNQYQLWASLVVKEVIHICDELESRDNAAMLNR